jgi:hypothetical protein
VSAENRFSVKDSLKIKRFEQRIGSKMKKVMIALGILILVGLAGCGKSTEESIVGKWKQVDGTQTIEFFKDGTVRIIDKGEPAVTGDYRFIDNNRIRMDFKGIGELFGAVIAEYQPKEDEIVLTNPMGKIEKYRRSQDRTEIIKAKALVHPKGISGKYVNQSDKNEYLELKSDGTFASSKSLSGLGGRDTGEWRVTTIISFVFRSHRGEPLEHDSIEGEIVGDTVLVEGISFGRWWHESLRKDITPCVRKGNAALIKTIDQDNKIWSMYSNEDWLFEFQLKKDRTFSISGKGEWELERNTVELRDPAKEGKIFRAEIDKYNTLTFLIYLMGAVFEKHNSAYIIEKVDREGGLWSRYVRGEDENLVLEFDKSGSFRMTGRGTWSINTGIICHDVRDKQCQWRAIVRDGALADSHRQTWAKQ